MKHKIIENLSITERFRKKQDAKNQFNCKCHWTPDKLDIKNELL